jgi:hypothetical protein
MKVKTLALFFLSLSVLAFVFHASLSIVSASSAPLQAESVRMRNVSIAVMVYNAALMFLCNG